MSNHHQRRSSNFMPNAEGINCADCDKLLDAYLDAALTHADVRLHYAPLWQHLQSCESCALHYQALYALLQPDEQIPPFVAPLGQLDLPFLPRTQSVVLASARRPWGIYLRSALIGEPFLLRFSFSPAYLQRRLIHVALPLGAASAEVHENIPTSRLLLREPIAFGEQIIVAKVSVFFSAELKDFVHLQAIILSAQPPAVGLRATLQWGTLLRSCRVTQTGKADLGEVPLAAVQPDKPPNSAIFAITFAATTADKV